MLGKTEGRRRRGRQRVRWLMASPRLDGHEFEQAPGVGDGRGRLVCCSPWGYKESDTTERQNNSNSSYVVHYSRYNYLGQNGPCGQRIGSLKVVWVMVTVATSLGVELLSEGVWGCQTLKGLCWTSLLVQWLGLWASKSREWRHRFDPWSEK